MTASAHLSAPVAPATLVRIQAPVRDRLTQVTTTMTDVVGFFSFLGLATIFLL